MRKRRLIKNYVEFLLLCVVAFLHMKWYSRSIEGFAFTVVAFLSVGYAVVLLVNLVLQNMYLTGKMLLFSKN